MVSKEIKTLDELNEVISNENLSCVRFHASWCGPCKQLGNVIEKMDVIDGVQFYGIDVDDAEEITEKYGIQSVPTTLFFKDGCELEKHVGFMSETMLKNKIQENLSK